MNNKWNEGWVEVGWFFKNPRVFALAVETESNRYEYVTEAGSHGEAVVCFLSPLDAHIAGMLQAKPGLKYHVTLAGSILPESFTRPNGVFAANLHLAFAMTANGYLALCEDGRPRWFGGSLVKKADHDPKTFEVGTTAMRALDRLYEQAGLFAWRETCESQWMCVDGRLEEAAREAIRLAGTVAVPDGDYPTRPAVFDPEFKEWHVMLRDFAEGVAISDD